MTALGIEAIRKGYSVRFRRACDLVTQLAYEVRSTIVTRNLKFSKWPEFIGDLIMATALVDRLVHRAAILNMNGEGYQLNNPNIYANNSG